MGGVYRIQTFFGFLYFFYIYKAPKPYYFFQNGGLIIWFSHPNYKFAARLLELVFLCCRPNRFSPI